MIAPWVLGNTNWKYSKTMYNRQRSWANGWLCSTGTSDMDLSSETSVVCRSLNVFQGKNLSVYTDRAFKSCLTRKHLTVCISLFPPGPFHQLLHCDKAQTYGMTSHPESKQSDKDSTSWPKYQHFRTPPLTRLDQERRACPHKCRDNAWKRWKHLDLQRERYVESETAKIGHIG